MVTSLLRNERVMPIGVVAIALVASALTVSLLGGSVEELLYGLGGGVVVSIVVVGIYTVGKRSGHPHSHAVAEAAIALGVLYLVALVTRLLTEFGA